MRTQQTQVNGGIGMGGALFLLFLGLKLTGHIDWSWWWVTAPLWIPLAIVASFFVIFATIMLIAFLFARKRINARFVRR